jgi:hypothetical protein
MSFSKYLKTTFAAFALSLAACNEIEVPNGVIPDEYLAAAATYVGTYRGEFDGYEASIDVRIDQENKVHLAYTDERGNDVVRPGCGSVIGDLKEIKGDDKNGQKNLKYAAFAFHGGTCPIDGRRLQLYIKHKRNGDIKVNMQLLEYTERREECYWDVIPGGGVRRVCRMNYYQHYLDGDFTKE